VWKNVTFLAISGHAVFVFATDTFLCNQNLGNICSALTLSKSSVCLYYCMSLQWE
jgi:hypothetical protein